MILAILGFLIGAGAVVGGYVAYMRVPDMMAQRRLDERLRDVSTPYEAPSDDTSLIVRTAQGRFDNLLLQIGAAPKLSRLIEQSGVKTTSSTIIFTSLLLATLAGLVTFLYVPQTYLAPVAAGAAGALPFVYLLNRRSIRLKRFEEQFPEALDLLARALRAGHAFQTSLGMVGDELKPPVGPEFKKTFDQQNFGLPLRDVLQQLSERIPILDVRFFVTAVMIQRDTGGNLSEILENLAHVVRERFKILRQVRVHTAHGRFTAFVLLALPAALAVALTFLNPDHMQPLFHTKLGQMMLIVAMIMEFIGFVWIRQVIKIEV